MFPSEMTELILDSDRALSKRRERTAARDPELAWSRGYALPAAALAAEPWLRRVQRRALAVVRWRPRRGAGILAEPSGSVAE